MNTNLALDLESALWRAAGVPDGKRDESRPDPASRRRWDGIERLRGQLRILEGSAAHIGAVPPGYPLPVRLVIRVIAALLPWYTRPLQAFVGESVRTQQRIVEAIENLTREMEAQMRGDAQ